MQMQLLFIRGLNLEVPNRLAMRVSSLPPSLSAKPNTRGAGQTSAEVMMMMMVMMTSLIEILKHSWLTFKSSGPFFSLAQPCHSNDFLRQVWSILVHPMGKLRQGSVGVCQGAGKLSQS